jgi:hypothetical protein
VLIITEAASVLLQICIQINDNPLRSTGKQHGATAKTIMKN